MKVGITGMPQSGKRTIFGLLTGAEPRVVEKGNEQAIGIAPVLDPRFDDLVVRYRPRKETRASFTVELLPDLNESSVRDGTAFKRMEGVDALCIVVRGFEDEKVYHVRGSVDAVRDAEAVVEDCILHDLVFIEKRMERIAEGRRKSDSGRAAGEEQILLKMREHLENNRPLCGMLLNDDEKRLVSGYPFLTMKAMIIVVNGGEAASKRATGIKEKYSSHNVEVISLDAKLESEIATLEKADERNDFLRQAGIVEPALSLLNRACMSSLGLISFFTVGDDEVRQWLVRRGAVAPEAAGVIHSDIQRGFIRAEVMKYEDLRDCGSEDAVKRAGKRYLMGRNYTVEDGDILTFRFNV